MHILLVVPRYGDNWGEFYQFPLGLGYIASAMKQAGHMVSGLNLNHHRGRIEDLVTSKIAAIQPDVCATGGLSPFLSLAQSIFSAARKAKPGIINIAGGGMVSGEPGVILDVMDIDYGVVGEGEITIVELLARIQGGGDLYEVNGIVFRDETGRTVETLARPQVGDLGTITWPDYDLLECEDNVSNQRALDSYFFQRQPHSKPRAIDMITSRSCPFKCTFCFHPTGKTYRERPLDDFFAELDTLVARYDINMVGLIDELFSLKRRRLLEFCARIKPYNLQWMVQLHVNSATEETVKAMRDSGCAYISYGIESMSQPVLESMQKKSRTHRIDEALTMTFESKIGIQGNLLFGDSAETLDTANESMHWWARNRQYQINLTPLMVFPGSPDYLKSLEDGLIVDRAAYVQDIPSEFNISKMNDKNMGMVGFIVWVFANSLLNVAPLTSFERSSDQSPGRDTAYDVVWSCPRCGSENEYIGVILPPHSGHTIRFTCRDCASRWDVENRAFTLPENGIDDATCRKRLQKAVKLFDRKKYGESHAIANPLMGEAPSFIPARLFMAEFYRRVGPAEHMLKSFGSALGMDPLSPDRHSDFAEALVEVGAHGAARLHYEQAINLNPDNERALSGLAYVDGPEVSDAQRQTYFVSWSDAPAPARNSSCRASAGELVA
ncbi:B12-binding domain-containing radical SAM protein [Varunaivibrio sulfuroxidans]|uniref:Radical SAM superfamily enzyme YgiQ (UPF0313 family) n=1 Tax=Varunaivibrio sulfuroxidans TaxID=1773489 RepID=A0A4R3JIT9_9PROT|nr:radical SAM protein [Varunaivibrio sulfuroxidans]TCS64730.1 radical SAM superfamily enzyme YgiQ (UPF0313 family) [Varunaivibrio sulfuroxidans]WES29965.1 cobalamin-dependent protein [Varunaivibrio sulfuroxidans]